MSWKLEILKLHPPKSGSRIEWTDDNWERHQKVFWSVHMLMCPPRNRLQEGGLDWLYSLTNRKQGRESSDCWVWGTVHSDHIHSQWPGKMGNPASICRRQNQGQKRSYVNWQGHRTDVCPWIQINISPGPKCLLSPQPPFLTLSNYSMMQDFPITTQIFWAKQDFHTVPTLKMVV